MAAEEIGSVYLSLRASAAQFESDMKAASNSARNHSAQISSSVKTVGNSFNTSMKSMLNFKNLLGGLAAGVSVSAFTMLMKQSIETADKMYKLAQAVGVPVEELSGLAYAASLSGVDVETLGKSLGILDKNMAAAAQGTGKAVAAFGSLRVNLKDSDGNLRSTEDVLLDLADKFSTMEDGAGKTAIAMAAFGRGGKDMIPMLNMGRAGIADMVQEAKKFGLVLTEETGAAAEHFHDNLERMEGITKGVAATIRDEAIPALNEWSDSLIESAKESDFLSKVTATTENVMKGLAATGSVAYAVFKTLGDGLAAVAAIIYTSVITAFRAAGGLIGGVSESMVKVMSGDFAGAKETVNKTFSDFAARVDQGTAAVNSVATEGLSNLKGTLTETWDEINQIWVRGYHNLTPPKDLEKKIKAPDIVAPLSASDLMKNLERKFAIEEAAVKAAVGRRGELLEEGFKAERMTEQEFYDQKRVNAVAAAEQELAMTRKLLADKEVILGKAMKGKEKDALEIDVEGTRTKVGELVLSVEQLLIVQTMQAEQRKKQHTQTLQDYDLEIRAVKELGEAELKYAGAANDEQSRQQVLVQQDIEMRKKRLDLMRAAGEIGPKEQEQLDKLAEKHREINKIIQQQIDLKQNWMEGLSKGLSDYYDEATNKFKAAQDFAVNTFKNMEDALVDFCQTGKLDFTAMANSIIKDLIRIYIQQQITGPLSGAAQGWLSNLMSGNIAGQGQLNISGGDTLFASAHGNVFNRGNVIPFARGGIVGRPTTFPMAQGMGLMGERGPEGILPLTRLSGGDLGVKASGGGDVYIHVSNNNGSSVKVQSRESSRGKEIDMTIDEMISKKLGSFGSAASKTLKQTYGAKERLTSR